MNEFQEKKVSTFLKISRLFEKNQYDLFKKRNVVRDVNVFQVRLDSILEELILSAGTTNEITTDISIARSLAIKLCNKFSIALKSYAKAENFSLLTRELFVEFASLENHLLLEYSTQIYEEANSVRDNLQRYGITEQDLNSFKNVINNLKQIVAVPGMMFNFRARTRNSFDENILENEKLLAALDELFDESDDISKEFYSEYMNCRDLIPA
jgi:hypothetical protein